MIGVVAITGCATVQPLQTSRSGSMATRYARVLDSIEVASSLEPDEVVSAPRIRLVVPPASYASTRYVDASFHVSEDAYVLVVAVDLDRRIRVVYPESPDQTGFASRSAPMRLTRFFAGFGGPRAGTWSGYESQYSLSQRISPFGGGGVLLAVASDRPLQYDRLIAEAGEWDEQQLARIVFDQSLSGAAHALGRALVLTGQEYNTDYTTFAGRRTLLAYSAFATYRADGCGFGGAYDGFDSFGYGGFGAYDSGPVTRFVGFFQVGGRTFARYATAGPCSRPVYHDIPVATPIPTPRDTTHRDSTAARPRHFPGAPRFPSVTGDIEAAPRRLTPSNLSDAERERPLRASGLRFRPPGQVAADPIRPIGRPMSPRDAGDSPARRIPASSEGPVLSPDGERRYDEPSRPTERYTVPQREARRVAPAREERARAEPVREERARAEPVRQEPVRAEPVRQEPVRAEPARAEPAHREPVRQPMPVMPQPTPR